MTVFEEKVYEVVSTIPFGETRTYKWVAEKCGHPGAQRAVGQVLNKNPNLFIIPCHRVVKCDGSIGGYRYGERFKQLLLDEERRSRFDSET